MEKKDPYESLRLRLDECHRWPEAYYFKFIVPRSELATLLPFLEGMTLTQRESRGGKYISVTASLFALSTDEVIAVYRRTAHIKGLLSV